LLRRQGPKASEAFSQTLSEVEWALREPSDGQDGGVDWGSGMSPLAGPPSALGTTRSTIANDAARSNSSDQHMHALGIDIGGSALKGAPVDTKTGKLLGGRFKVDTPDKVTPAAMAKIVDEIVAHFKWNGPIGVGFPGVVHGPVILTSANLHPKFIGLNVGKLFTSAAKQPVALLNDAAAAGLAEMTFGVGRKFQGKALLLTLGTGVGSAIFFRGTVIPLELGHLVFKDMDAEKYVAASIRKAEDLSWHDYGKRLREYIHFLENGIWPELIVIGGGVSAKHDKFFKYIKPRARLVPAEFLNEAGIVGAALWAAAEQAR